MKNQLSALLLMSACVCPVFSLDSHSAAPVECPDTVEAPYFGFTGTIDKLIESRPKVEFAVGSAVFDIDEFVLRDVTRIVECDALLSEYFESSDECYYERLADIIEQAIQENFNNYQDSIFTYVEASEDGTIVHVAISIEYKKNMLLPVHIETMDKEAIVSFYHPCVVGFTTNILIELDSEKTLNGDAQDGLSVSIDSFIITVKADNDMQDAVVPVLYYGEFQYANLADFTLDATFSWFPEGSVSDDGESVRLPYEEIARGDCSWQSVTASSMSLSLIVEGESETEDDGGNTLEFNYACDDLTENRDPCLEINEVGELSWFEIRMR